MRTFQYRLVLHESENTHCDLFILTGDLLTTYQIKSDAALPLRSSQTDGISVDCVIRDETAEKPPLIFAALAHRKSDHRMFYWDYSGPISDNRGTIREVARGNLHLVLPDFPSETEIQFYDAREQIRGILDK